MSRATLIRRSLRAAMGGVRNVAKTTARDAGAGATLGGALGYGISMWDQTHDGRDGIDGGKVYGDTLGGFGVGALGGAAVGRGARTVAGAFRAGERAGKVARTVVKKARTALSEEVAPTRATRGMSAQEFPPRAPAPKPAPKPAPPKAPPRASAPGESAAHLRDRARFIESTYSPAEIAALPKAMRPDALRRKAAAMGV